MANASPTARPRKINIGKYSIRREFIYFPLDHQTYILDLLKVPSFYIVYLRSYAKKYGNVAGATGLEPATSGVTGRHSNQLNYAPN